MCTDTHRSDVQGQVHAEATRDAPCLGAGSVGRRLRARTGGFLGHRVSRAGQRADGKMLNTSLNVRREQRKRRSRSRRSRSSRRVWPSRCVPVSPARRWGRAHVDVVLPAHGRGGRVHRGRALLFAPLSPPWAPSGAPREGCPQRRAQVTPPARGHGRCHRAGAAGLPAPAGGTRRRLGLVLAADIDKGLPSKAQADPPDRWRCGEIIKTVRARKRERHSDRSASCGEQD